jgi:hypothetical protein
VVCRLRMALVEIGFAELFGELLRLASLQVVFQRVKVRDG